MMEYLHLPSLVPNICEGVQYVGEFIGRQVLRLVTSVIDGPE